MKPSSLTYDIGQTRHGQRLTLEHRNDIHGGQWTIVQHAANQRDETSRVSVTDLIADAILGAFR